MFDPGCLMLVDEAKSQPLSGAPERCFSRVGLGLTRKLNTRQERSARSKQSHKLRKKESVVNTSA